MEPITAVAAAGVALVVKAALESAGQEAGRAGWGGCARLLERVRGRFRGDPEAEGALSQVERAPGDNEARADFERALLAHMLRDRQFESDVRGLVEDAQRGGNAPQVNAAVIKNAQVFNDKVEIQGDWNVT